jgi:hypothetical protein
MTEQDYFEHATDNTIPTPPGQEDITPTDMLSEAVEEIMDNIEEAFTE